MFLSIMDPITMNNVEVVDCSEEPQRIIKGLCSSTELLEALAEALFRKL